MCGSMQSSPKNMFTQLIKPILCKWVIFRQYFGHKVAVLAANALLNGQLTTVTTVLTFIKF